MSKYQPQFQPQIVRFDNNGDVGWYVRIRAGRFITLTDAKTYTTALWDTLPFHGYFDLCMQFGGDLGEIVETFEDRETMVQHFNAAF